MPRYEAPWPQWMPEEVIMMVWFCSRGLEARDVANLINYKLHRTPRSLEGFFNKMKKINQEEARKGHRKLCRPGMADWDVDAVDNFLIRLTDDTKLFDDLLWFDSEHITLLEMYRHIPQNEILDVEGMKRQWALFLNRHAWSWGNPPPDGRDYFF